MKYLAAAIKLNTAFWGVFHGWKVISIYWAVEPLGAVIVACAIALGVGEILFGGDWEARL